MEQFFKLKERKAAFRTEFIAGMTTFFFDGLYSDGQRQYVCRSLLGWLQSVGSILWRDLYRDRHFCGDIKKIKFSFRIIAFLFIAMLLLTH